MLKRINFGTFVYDLKYKSHFKCSSQFTSFIMDGNVLKDLNVKVEALIHDAFN